MQLTKYLIAFVAGLVVCAALLLGVSFSSSCSSKFYEVRLLEIIQFIWTVLVSGAIGLLLTRYASRRSKGEDLLSTLLGNAYSAAQVAQERFEDYIEIQDQVSMKRTIRAFKRLREAVHLSGRFTGHVPGLNKEQLKARLASLPEALRPYGRLATDFSQSTPFGDESIALVHEKYQDLCTKILELRMVIITSA